MKKEMIQLTKGNMEIYDFGVLRLHAYQTNDLLNDECYLLENETEVLCIEFPAFQENIIEFENYVKKLNKKIVGKVFSDHPNGGTIFKSSPGYASQGTIQSMEQGTIYHLVEGFKETFGSAFVSEYHQINHVLTEKNVQIGGFQLEIIYHNENIEIKLPQINVVYTHMMGHDCHSLMMSKEQIDMTINQLSDYVEKNYTLILSSHYTPEMIGDVKTKIEYLNTLQKTLNTSHSKEEFMEQMKTMYLDYQGLNYLEMTANACYKK